MSKNKVYAITGANGYVGGALTSFLNGSGYKVYELNRRENSERHFLLGEPPSLSIFEGVDVLVHCAWDFNASTKADIQKINVEGSIRLFDMAQRAGVLKIIFISTMSAFNECSSLYGKAKLEVERGGGKYRIISVRPGLVYGHHSGGMIGALNSLVNRTRIIPLVGGGKQKLYLVHQDDLAQLILHLGSKENCCEGHPILAASEEGKTFREILIMLGETQGKKLKFIPIPWTMPWVGLKFLEKLGVKSRLKSDGLISLINFDKNPDFSWTRKTGVAFRSFEP